MVETQREVVMKTCSKCKVEKELTEFQKDKSRKDKGYSIEKGSKQTMVELDNNVRNIRSHG